VTVVDRRVEEREMNWFWTIGAPIVSAMVALVFRVRVEGIDNVPRTGAVVLAANHISVLDGPALSAVTGSRRRRATRNLVAAELFRGVIGWILRQARQIPISRGSGDARALDDAVEAARCGACVGIFPEGRVHDDPDRGLQRVRSGLTRIAIAAGVPVVPVGIWGTHRVWPRGGLELGSLPRRHTLAIVYGGSIVPHPGESPEGFRERYHHALEEVVVRARALAGDDDVSALS
jgi:1-acyl-sn-glycerol-3-phosphate acyltransferase